MAKTAIKRQIQLAGAGKVFYNVSTSDEQAILWAIHQMEQEQGKIRGALVKGFRDKFDQNLWDRKKVEVHII
jgi:hypothetical protein